MTDPLDEARWNALEEARSNPGEAILGDLFKAAEVAKVMPNTLRVWMSRGKLKPLFGEPGKEIFHIPTVVAVAEAGREARRKRTQKSSPPHSALDQLAA
ncbi:hypothetical protein [Streptomyces griseorubiginosus]|uniref:hypothetical protein n=1 Tax=Streptomyces griseorubiginosus TaxID=67304 RepID=UPI0033241C41